MGKNRKKYYYQKPTRNTRILFWLGLTDKQSIDENDCVQYPLKKMHNHWRRDFITF